MARIAAGAPKRSALGSLDAWETTVDERRVLITEACRVLANSGLAEDILGHVSLRAENGALLIRCRGPRERGLLFTESSDIHLVNSDESVHSPLGDYQIPNEFPIHREIFRARPEVQAVVHAHPPAVVAADLAGLKLRPIVGAYNIPAMRMASETIPVYPRSVLINRTDLAVALAQTLGDSDVCILRGHGIVAVGASVEQAMVRAINIEALARMTLLASSSGRTPSPLPPEDIEEMPDLGSTFNDMFVWRHHVSKLEIANLGVRPRS